MFETWFAAREQQSWLCPPKERMSNDETGREVLSAISSGIVEPAIFVFARGPSILGMAIHADRAGQAERHQQGRRILHRSWYTRSSAERLLCLGARVWCRPPFNCGTWLTTDSPDAGHRYACRLHHGRSRSAGVNHFASRQLY